ncbi:hypothetical protein LPJ75_006174, partial [Coemansia sp. RSA 2598]
ANSWAKSAAGLGYFAVADIGGFVESTVNSPKVAGALGLTDVKTSCVGGNLLNLIQADNKLLALLKLIVDAKQNLMCDDPSENYFMDFVHPAERIQRLFGYYSREVIMAAKSGKQLPPNEDTLLALVSKYNLGGAVAKPVRV